MNLTDNCTGTLIISIICITLVSITILIGSCTNEQIYINKGYTQDLHGPLTGGSFKMRELVLACMLFVCSAAYAEPFTVAVLPDTQWYTWQFPDLFTTQTQWIVDNYEEGNIVMVTHLCGGFPNGNLQEWLNGDVLHDEVITKHPRVFAVLSGHVFGHDDIPITTGDYNVVGANELNDVLFNWGRVAAVPEPDFSPIRLLVFAGMMCLVGRIFYG